MIIRHLHAWDLDFKQAKAVQSELQKQINICPLNKEIRYIAGADVSYSIMHQKYYAALIIFKFPELTITETHTAAGDVHFPYVPGYLTFREAPILLDAFRKIKTEPDVVIFDGQGIAHPRKMGLAAHVGIILDIPSIGCAKNKLIGSYDMPGNIKGFHSPLVYRNEQIGAVVRTRTKVKPVFVSPGHKITLEESISLVLASATQYRIPEPTRQAHLLVNRIRHDAEIGLGVKK